MLRRPQEVRLHSNDLQGPVGVEIWRDLIRVALMAKLLRGSAGKHFLRVSSIPLRRNPGLARQEGGRGARVPEGKSWPRTMSKDKSRATSSGNELGHRPLQTPAGRARDSPGAIIMLDEIDRTDLLTCLDHCRRRDDQQSQRGAIYHGLLAQQFESSQNSDRQLFKSWSHSKKSDQGPVMNGAVA